MNLTCRHKERYREPNVSCNCKPQFHCIMCTTTKQLIRLNLALDINKFDLTYSICVPPIYAHCPGLKDSTLPSHKSRKN